MSKYNYEFKKEVVRVYENREGGYTYLSKKYGVASTRDIRKWVANYRKFGDE